MHGARAGAAHSPGPQPCPEYVYKFGTKMVAEMGIVDGKDNVISFPQKGKVIDNYEDILDVVRQIMEGLGPGETLVMYVADEDGNPK